MTSNQVETIYHGGEVTATDHSSERQGVRP